MGNEYSADGEAAESAGDATNGAEYVEDAVDMEAVSGYRVMKVFRGSPASRSGLSPFEDFVIAVNGTLVDGNNGALASVLSANEGKEVALVVWNCIDAAERDVALRPVKWNGPGLLGAAVRFEAVRGAAESVWRVLDVLPNSPADDAGLVPRTDYIVGTPATVFRKEAEFGRLIREAIERQAAASMMVYSTATSRVRNVEIRPDRNWGGEGSLGCELATGLLHRITRGASS